MPPPTAAPRPRPSDAACEVLARALDVVITDVDAWDQSVYGRRSSCGTTYCLAGTIAVLVLGHAPCWVRSSSGDDAEEFMDGVYVPDADGSPRLRAVHVVAARALELVEPVDWPGHRPDVLPDDRADALFDGGRSLRRLVELAFRYTDGRVDRLAAYAALAAARPDLRHHDRRTEAAEAVALGRSFWVSA